MLLIVPLKVSSHFTVVESMQEALSLTTQNASDTFLPQLQLLCERVSCVALRANFMVLDGKSSTAFAYAATVSEVVAQNISAFFWGSYTCSSLSQFSKLMTVNLAAT